MKKISFQFSVLGFQFSVSRLEFRVLGFAFSVLGFGFRVSGFKLQTSNRKPQTPNHKPKTLNLILLTTLLLALSGCYSFRGTTLSPDIKSVTITNFTMGTAGGPANMALQFNEKMKEYYQRNTSLALLPLNGDLQLEGSITAYEVTPAAPTANDQAALNRLSITIQVKFTNNKDEEKNFDQSFSFFKDFPQSQTLSQVESRLVPQILDQIVQDIFNKSAGDW
ncbi:LptE family protein [Runella limosa]|uniref:LptE family protein n=1 Tax=Runella limosa TaxID=370978 RepID=UPI00286E9995|nr:LptE family protein [Runella limosa]